jgi:serine/threonine protein kinase
VETGRVIQRRYLLQRLIEQGQNSVVYQGFDHVLQRPVAVKVPFAEHIPAYRAAIRSTSQFTHPNIIGLYDMVAESEQIYIVQEFIEGDTFISLLQSQLPAYQIVDLGVQVCYALLYAGSGARKICHGDLTTSAIIRDRHGTVHVNNFALPSDIAYFTTWNTLGGNEQIISDSHLSWGQLSEGRRDDDTHALGLLLYQLLAGRGSGGLPEGPPVDGRLHFMRNTPPELCEVVARAVIRQHPQHIATPEALLVGLKPIAEALEPVIPVEIVTPAEEVSRIAQGSPVTTGNLVTSLSTRTATPVGAGHAQVDLPSTSFAQEISPSAPTIAGISTRLADARQAAYPFETEAAEPSRVNFPVLLGVGVLLFALFFAIGFFLAHTVLPLP